MNRQSLRNVVSVALTLILVLTAGVMAVQAWQAYHEMHTPEYPPGLPPDLPPTNIPSPRATGQLADTPATDTTMNLLLPTDPVTADDLVRIAPGDQVLTTSPADLDPPADSTRVLGFRRQVGSTTQEVVMHRVKGTAAAALAHYDKQAQARGFTRLQQVPAQPGTPGSATYVRGTEQLVIRTTPEDTDHLRLLIMLRYDD